MRYRLWRGWVFTLVLTPLCLWFYQAWRLELGPDPGKTLVDRLGLGGLTLLLITLAMAPLQRVAGWSGWMAVRRQLGLWTFAYAVLHVAAYAVFLQGLDGAQLLIDLRKRPYIFVGALAWLGLLVLAVTSNRFSMRRLGKLWKRLHCLVYPVLLLALLHMLWVVRADLTEWLVYACVGLFLLLLRLPFVAASLSSIRRR